MEAEGFFEPAFSFARALVVLASLLRRPLMLLLIFALIAVVGGVLTRAQEKAAQAAAFPLSTPEAQQAAQQQMTQALTQITQDAEAARQAAIASDPSAVAPSMVATTATAAPSMTTAPSGPQIVGIPSEAFDVTYSTQRNSQWCWAASIQMALQYHGIKTVQQDIVARTFGPNANGELPNRPGDLAAITANLNNFNVDRAGTTYQVEANFGEGPPPVALLLDELDRREPIIIGYSTGANTGHAVVITGARFQMTPQGPQVLTLIVRDPWPSDATRQSNGRIEYDAREFAPKIHGYWRIRVRQ